MNLQLDRVRPQYRLELAKPPWGDYGRILLSGMTRHEPRTSEGLLRLARTGPFVPPITVAGMGDLLVTDAFRTALERSPLAGTGFRPVEKTRIVRLEWERWIRPLTTLRDRTDLRGQHGIVRALDEVVLGLAAFRVHRAPADQAPQTSSSNTLSATQRARSQP